ncbi:hypothetical protein AMTRI_Chr07g26570 [Amborella trichopoda]
MQALSEKIGHKVSVDPMYEQLSLEHKLRFSLNGENGAPNNASSQTKNYEITLFHFGKAAITRVSLIFPSQKEEREIIFPFCRDQEIGSIHKKRRMLGINII